MSTIIVNNYYGTMNLKQFSKEQILTESFEHFLERKLQRDFGQEPEKVIYKITQLGSDDLAGLVLGKDSEGGYHVYHFSIKYNNYNFENVKAFLNSPLIQDIFEVCIPKTLTPQEYYKSKEDYFESQR